MLRFFELEKAAEAEAAEAVEAAVIPLRNVIYDIASKFENGQKVQKTSTTLHPPLMMCVRGRFHKSHFQFDPKYVGSAFPSKN